MDNLKRLAILSFFTIILLASGCGQQKGSGNNKGKSDASSSEMKKLENLEERTLAIHDSIMPKMDSLVRLKNKLDTLLKYSKNEAKAKALRKVSHNLESAKDEMMNWMASWTKEYKPAKDTMSADERRDRLNELNNEIEELQKNMNENMARAADLIEKAKNER